MKSPPKCACGCGGAVPPTTSNNGIQRRYVNAAHRAAHHRLNQAGTLADLVERLGPYITDDGIEIYRELVGHLAGRVNERL